jgi:hypothetical protein
MPEHAPYISVTPRPLSPNSVAQPGTLVEHRAAEGETVRNRGSAAKKINSEIFQQVTRAPRRLYRFHLTEAKRERPRRAPNPEAQPDPPELSRALFLERLAAIADAYRRRGAIARRLARPVQSARAPLRTPPVPAALWPRLPGGFRNMLDHLGQRLAGADTS